ncbi:MAG: hypothetical protein LBJ67_15880 [Planctomycetaceae bacterium]|jgi:hypothetical protein|nr:hypothetical protein [Planctomycetaceae bacterium]
MAVQGKRYMPTREGEFVAWAKTILRACTEHQHEWGLAPDLMTQFTQLMTEADNAYRANSNKILKNRLSVIAKNDTFRALRQFLRTFLYTLLGNLAVSNESLTAMGVRPRVHPAKFPTPVPDEAPETAAVVGQNHEVTVYVSQPRFGRPVESLKKPHYYGFLLKYKIEGEAEWKQIISTKLHHTLIFEQDDRGKFLLIQAAWVNPRIQNGVWSEEKRELIN